MYPARKPAGYAQKCKYVQEIGNCYIPGFHMSGFVSFFYIGFLL